LIKLRLQRKGRKKRPYYHIVVADSRAPRDGRIIEKLGRFDNVSQRQELIIDEDRIIHWLKIGATPSDTVRSILKGQGIMYKMHLMRWGKSEEEIEAALEEWRSAREGKGDKKELSRKEKQQEALKAEEKAYKKEVEERAAAAAKELEKKKEEEAKAKAEEEAAAKKEDDDAAPKAEAAETEAKTDDAPAEKKEEPKAEAKEEEKKEAPKPEVKAEEAPKKEEPKAEAKEEEKSEAKAEKSEEKAEAKEEPKAKKEEVKEEPKEEKKADAPSQVSTDMNATEAIDHIKDTPLNKLEGFVPEDEDRVTVQRAWESKQSE